MYTKLALFLPFLAAATPITRDAAGPDPGLITIVDSTYSGNGCPQGSVSTSTSTDKTVSYNEPLDYRPVIEGAVTLKSTQLIIGEKVITYGFDQFQTYIGP
jgi:hypothetical protein